MLVALLRGINVGGSSVIKMATVRELAEDCGFTSVRTYVQSGNVVFRTTTTPARASAALGAALNGATGNDIALAVRTPRELDALIARCPYDDVSKVHVTFVVDGADPPAPVADPADFAPEHFTVRGRDTYLFLPHGIGRSKLAQALAKGRAARIGTTRNWRTVTALARLAADPA